MYERFTDRARKVMQLANQEAERFNYEYVGTEHVLLSLIKEGSGVAANVLKNLDVDLRKIRNEVEKIVQAGPDMVTMGKLPQTPRAKKVIEYAIEEARNLNHNYVGTEHLLLGLLREQEGMAAQVLMNLNLKLDEVREEVLNLLGFEIDAETEAESPTAQQSDPSWPLLDPDSPFQDELYEQIERLNEDEQEALAEKDLKRVAILHDRATELRKRAQSYDAKWRKTIKRFQNHPFVHSYRSAIIHLNSQFPIGNVHPTEQDHVKEAEAQCLGFKKLLHQLYQRLENDPDYGLPNDTISKFTLEIPWFEGRCVRSDELETCLQAVRARRRVVIVGPTGSGRRTLTHSLARSIFHESAESERVPVRVVALNHCALDGTGRYGEALVETLAAVRANTSYLLALEELHLCVEGDCSSREVIEAWRLAMLDCLEKNHVFAAWTTPPGAERLEAVWPTLLQDAVVLRLSPIPDRTLQVVVEERIAALVQSRPISFSDDFVKALLDERCDWDGGAGLSDPGRTLDLLEQVVAHSLATQSLGRAEAPARRRRRARPAPPDVLNLESGHIRTLVQSVKGLK